MWNPRLRAAALVAAGAISLSACAYEEGYGGYGGVSVGYRGGDYCDPRWDGCYGYGDYGYGDDGAYDPWYGWWGGYYYPGTGFYIYDQGGRRYRWNDNQRRYWEGRRQNYGNRDWNDRRWERWDNYRNQNGGQWQGRQGSGQWQGRQDGQWQGQQGTGQQGTRQWQGQQGTRQWQATPEQRQQWQQQRQQNYRQNWNGGSTDGSTGTTTGTTGNPGTWSRGDGRRRRGG
jgi:hypothetical protein